MSFKKHGLDICVSCGTNQSNDQTGYCINGHDDWLELRDLPGHWPVHMRDEGQEQALRRAKRKFKMTNGELVDAIITGKDLSV